MADSRWYVDERGRDSSWAIRVAGTGRACVDRKRSTRSADVAAGTGRVPKSLTPAVSRRELLWGSGPFSGPQGPQVHKSWRSRIRDLMLRGPLDPGGWVGYNGNMSPAAHVVPVGEGPLSFADVLSVRRHNAAVELSAQSPERISVARRIVGAMTRR